MRSTLLTSRERTAWIAGFVFIASLLVAMRFASVDADSVRYADISAKLSTLPVARWVAPEWWGLSPDNPLSGYFLEHPAGLFFIPAALGKMGVPAAQAPYIFGLGAGLAALLLAGFLTARLSSPDVGRAGLVLLQFIPLAFVFRIRDNHEYPMLVCLLATLVGLERLNRSWGWSALVAIGLTAALLIKGVFVVLVLLGAGVWIVFNPTGGSRGRQAAACGLGLAVMAVTALVYDVWYVHVTGGPFWRAYWERQLGPLQVESPIGEAWTFVRHLGFYAGRLLFHPAPWSLALIALASKRRRVPAATPECRGLWFVLAFTACSVLLLSLASRFAERYAFSASYLVGAAGAACAYRIWPVVTRAVRRLDAAVPALPVVVWIVLAALRLLLGPWLPRLGG